MIQITLSAKQLAYIIGLLPNTGNKDVIRLITQVAKQAIFDANGSLVNPEQPITVNVPEGLVIEVHAIMGTQQERLAASMNKAIQTALLPQVAGSQTITAAITARQNENGTILADVLANTYKFLLELQ